MARVLVCTTLEANEGNGEAVHGCDFSGRAQWAARRASRIGTQLEGMLAIKIAADRTSIPWQAVTIERRGATSLTRVDLGNSFPFSRRPSPDAEMQVIESAKTLVT